MNFPIYLLLAAVLGAFAANVVMLPFLIRLSHKKEWYDEVNHRKIHEGNIPRLGGFGIFFSFTIGTIIFFLIRRFFYPDLPVAKALDLWPLFAGLLFIHTLGLVDDFKNVKPLVKVAVQVAAAGIVVAFGSPILHVDVPALGISFSLGPAGYVLTLLWIIGMSNAMNLVDGLDGLAGGITAIAAFFIGLVALLQKNYTAAGMGFVLFGGVVGFLVFNFPPAKLFMGDSGSLFLGFYLAVLPFTGSQVPSKTTVLLAVTITMCAIPILDTLAAVLRRMRAKKPFYSPDKAHLHHKFLDLGLSSRGILLVVYSICIVFGGVFLVSVLFEHLLFLFLVPVVWAAAILLFLVMDVVYRKHRERTG
jgi:UDP-GlcNAc:undecaprenyl-phosphate GlcNAc-1-phosphate transferase